MRVPIEAAHREMYWQIASPYKFIIYPMMAVALGFFAWGAYQKYKFIMAGRPDPKRLGDWKQRARLVLWEIPFQTRVLKDRIGGIMHVLIFWSFLALTVATAIIFVDADFKIPIFHGPLYLVVSLAADLAGLALLVGVGIAIYRRYITKAARLDNQWDDALVLGLLGLMMVTGFVMEGMRIAYAGDQWAAWSPVGLLFSLPLGNLGAVAARRVYQGLWWFHASLAFGFIASVPYTKFSHLITVPVNAFFQSLEPKGSWPRVDIEALMSDEAAMENFNVGVSEVKDLTWKTRLDLDSCLRCGRCEEVCPAHTHQHPLSPKQLVADLKEFAWTEHRHSLNGNGKPPTTPAEETAEAEPKTIVGNALDPDTIWECRTCRACMEVCPAHLEHVPAIMELRRGEVMMRGQIPSEGVVALKTLERGGNPFGPQEERINWIKDFNIPVIAQGEECEVLIWVGCCTTYDQVKQKVAYNVLTILHEAGVECGVIGEDEMCCGDPARVLGDENLFQSIVKEQIKKIESRKFKYMVTHCPHCYNNFKNEYPQFGSTFKVLHHTEIIHQLIIDKRIDLELPVNTKVAFHDPCYLGRYNDIYDKPREILQAIKGVELVEFDKTRERSQCCGAGGGHYWMDIQHGERINVSRVRDAALAEIETVAVGCVFCLQMLNDSVKILDLEDRMKIRDISELVVDALGGLHVVAANAGRQVEEEDKAA